MGELWRWCLAARSLHRVWEEIAEVRSQTGAVEFGDYELDRPSVKTVTVCTAGGNPATYQHLLPTLTLCGRALRCCPGHRRQEKGTATG